MAVSPHVISAVVPLRIMNTPFLLLEVMDKEPSLLQIWSFFLLIGAVGFLLCRKHPAFLSIAVPVALFLSWAWMTELHDPFVGPAIVQEAGYSYVVQSYLAMIATVVLPCLGAFLWWRKKKAFA